MSEALKELITLGFVKVGCWKADPALKMEVRVHLDSMQSERVIYAFVMDDTVLYIGACQSKKTTLSGRVKYPTASGGAF